MKIFLVEDAPLLRKVLRNTIEELGGEVVGESDSQDDALHGIAETSPEVVVLDLRLVTGNGVEVLRQMKASRPDVKVMVLTNCSQTHYRTRCLELGADYFFDKAADFPMFVGTLAGMSRGGVGRCTEGESR